MQQLQNATVTFLVAEELKEIDVGNDDVVTIIDEVDNVLIDHGCFLARKTKKSKVVGLTATSTRAMIDMETSVFEEYQFDLRDSMITYDPVDIDGVGTLGIEDFVGNSFNDKAKIIFIDDSRIDEQNYRILFNDKDAIFLKNSSDLE